MAPLTWREVAAPNFAGVSESQRLAGTLLNTGFDSAIKALEGFGTAQGKAVDSEFMSRIASYGNDTKSLFRDLNNGTIYDGLTRGGISADAYKFGLGREADVLANTQTGVQTEGMRLNNQNQGLVNDQLAFNNQTLRGYEAARPAAVDLVNQIRTFSADGTPEGRAKARELTLAGSKVLADAGYTTDDIAGLINGNLSTTEAGVGTNTTLRNQGDAVRLHGEEAEARNLYEQVIQAAGGDVGAAERLIRENLGSINPQVATLTLSMLGSDGAKLLQSPDTNAASYLLQATVDAQQSGNSAAPLQGLIVGTESGRGGYSALYGQAQEPGGAFAGADVTKMTLDQMDQFEQSGYGDWVKDQVGRTATPAGMYQIVGDTRRQVAKEMGLSGDTLFNQATQDAMFQHLVNKRLSSADSMAGKMAGLRQEWEGFKQVPDRELRAAIEAYESGDRNALTGASPLGPDPRETVAAFDAALNKRGALSTNENEALFTGAQELANQAASVMDAMTVDGLFGTSALASNLLDPSLARESQSSSVARVRAALGEGIDIADPELTDNINQIKDRYGLSFGQAAVILENSVHQEPWVLKWIQGNANVDFGKEMDALVNQVYNKDGKTKGQKFAPAMDLLETARAKENAASTLEQTQGLVQAAQQRYVNLLNSVRTRRNPTPLLQQELERAQLEYQALLGQLEQTISRIDSDPTVGFNIQE
jgi:hypothetical protein